MYVNSAMRFASDGEWLTPKLMGRLFLFKAPLLEWLSALSIRSFGLGLITVRLPSLIAGALAVVLVFFWTARRRTWVLAGVAALLLMFDPIWRLFSRLAMTDVLAATLAFAAMFVVATDPMLARRRSRILFGALAGLAVLAKSVVGALPFGALVLYWIVVRPRAARLAECAVAAVVVAAPWHLYQLVAHPQWFWTEYVRFQLLAVGVTDASGVIGVPLFYLRRMLVLDPVLSLLSLIAAYGVVRTWRERDPVRVAALSWAVMVILALAVFRGRSVSYLPLLIPALCVSVGLFLPRVLWPVAAVLVIAVPFIKFADAPPAVESAAAFRTYYLEGRDTTLAIAAPDDAFYPITLPGLRVRYCYVDPTGAVAKYLPHYAQLGITIPAVQLADLPALEPVFASKLAEWGVHSTEPVAEAILLRTPADLQLVARAFPSTDFNVPASWLPLLSASHDAHLTGERAFLLVRGAVRHIARTLPAGW
jgi:hypothetical protein